jgi:membrane protease YdiL (CAAX protease family)
MTYTLSIFALLAGYMWVAVPVLGAVPGLAIVPMIAILGLCAQGNRRSGGDWGLRREGLRLGLAWALGGTLPLVLLLLALGCWLGTLTPGDHLALRFLLLLVWALMQQLVLQTVVFREARQKFGRRAAIPLAAGFFAAIHLPNPFLTPVTFVAALAWCWLYDRYPNLIPIALSHAAASLAVLVAFGPQITGGMRVGYGYFLQHGSWSLLR